MGLRSLPRPRRPLSRYRKRPNSRSSGPTSSALSMSTRPRLTLDWSRAEPLELNASETAQVAELAPIVDGKPDVSKLTSIDLEALAHEYRTQKIIFETARDVFDLMKPSWAGSRESLIAQLVKLVEQFIYDLTGLQSITPPLFYQKMTLRGVLITTLNMTKVVQHVWDAVRVENTERLEPVFDRDHPIRSTSVNMATWYTGKPCNLTDRSHINMCVYDSTWEASEAFELDHNPLVDAWVKNDHLGFEVLYVYRGVVRKYRPDFIIPLEVGQHAGSGDQGATGRAELLQAPRSGTVGSGRQPARRLRPLVGRCFLQPRGHQGHSGDPRERAGPWLLDSTFRKHWKCPHLNPAESRSEQLRASPLWREGSDPLEAPSQAKLVATASLTPVGRRRLPCSTANRIPKA